MTKRNYQKELDSYLASVDAVIDGAQKRYEKSYSLLLEYIEENTATKNSGKRLSH